MIQVLFPGGEKKNTALYFFFFFRGIFEIPYVQVVTTFVAMKMYARVSLVAYLPEFTCRKMKSLLQLLTNSYIKQHGPFTVHEGDWNWEDDAIWEIVVPYASSQKTITFRL